MKRVLLILVAGLALGLALSTCESDPVSEVLSVQRILIQKELGFGPGFVTDWGLDQQEGASVRSMSPNIFHVENWYTTKLSGDRKIRYQMVVEKKGDTYYNRCFITCVEIEDGAAPCF